MLAHSPLVASGQSYVDLVVHHSSQSPALKSCVLHLVENPTTRRGGGGFARSTCRLRCRSTSTSSSSSRHVERPAEGRGRGRGRGGKNRRNNELRLCRVALISAAELEESSAVDSSSSPSPAFDLETAHHESAAALISSGAEAAVQDGEWQSLGRDGGVERLSTSSSVRGGSELVAFNGSVGSISLGTTEFEASPIVEWPVEGEGGTADEEGLGLRNGEGLHNGKIVHHPEINNVTEAEEDEEEGDVLVSAQEGLTEDQLPIELIENNKQSYLGVRKPSQPPAKIDPEPRASQVTAKRRDERPEPEHEHQPEPQLQEDLEYFVPKIGDEVTGVVVSGNDYQLDVDIGAKHLGRLLAKDLKPFDVFRAGELFWELDESGFSMPAMSAGQFRFLGDREALMPTHPLVPVGTVITLKVLGVTLSGRAVLSARKIASRIAWQRVRQIHEQDEPIEAQCVAWNSDGLVFKIEGLRATLPQKEFLNRSKLSKPLKDHVGEWKKILITDVDEATGELLVSEKRAWTNLRIGSLVIGTVLKIYPFGVEVVIDGTSLRAMLHISNISRCYIPDIKSVFRPGEKVKALIVDSGNPRRIGLSTVDLESSQGLMLKDRERVFQEADEIAARKQSPLSGGKNYDYGTNIDTNRTIEDPCPANQDWLDFGEKSSLDTSNKEQ